MVQLVEDKQRGAVPASPPKYIRCKTDLLIGHDCAMVVVGFNGLLVCQRRIQVNPNHPCGSRPLRAQMVGRTDDQHTASHSISEVLMGNPESEASFPRRWCRCREKIRPRMS